jgi:hypothetical protein
MITSFEVAAIFSIEDAASQPLSAIAAAMEVIAEASERVKAGLGEIGATSFEAAQRGINAFSDAIGALNAEVAGTAEAVQGVATATAAAAREAVASIGTIASAWAEAAAAQQAYMAAAMRPGNFAGSGGAGPALLGYESGAAAGGGGAITVGGAGGSGIGRGGIPLYGAGGIGGGGSGGGGSGGSAGGSGSPGGGGGGGVPFIPIAAAAYETYSSVSDAMGVDMALRQTLNNVGFTDQRGPNYDPNFAEDMERMRALLQGSADGTIFSMRRLGPALAGSTGIINAPGDAGLKGAERLFPTAARLGELSEMRGKGSAEHEAVAAYEMAHLMNEYDPAKMSASMDLVNAIAEHSDSNVAAQQRIMKYGLPAAQAAGIPMDQAVRTIGYAEQSLGATSTVGTGFSQFILGALNTGGGINAHLARARDNGERELRKHLLLEGDTEAAAHHSAQMHGSAHEKALIDLGITDKNHKLLDVDGRGNFDLSRLEQQVQDYGAHHQKADVERVMKDAFGDRGMRFAMQLASPDAKDRQARYDATIAATPSVLDQQHALAASPLQQFEQIGARLTDINTVLGASILPTLTAGFEKVVHAVSWTSDFLNDHKSAADLGGVSLATMGGLLAVRAARSVPGWIGAAGRYLGLGVGEGGALTGAEAAGGTAMGAAAAPLVLIAGATTAIKRLADDERDYFYGSGASERYRKYRDAGEAIGQAETHADTPTLYARLAARGDFGAKAKADAYAELAAHPPVASPPKAAPVAPPAAPTITNTFHVTVTGTDDKEGVFERLFHELADKLNQSLTHMGIGGGTMGSAYTTGAGGH